MIASHLLVISLLFCSLLPTAFAEETAPSPQQNSHWRIQFELEEYFREKDKLPRAIRIEINDTGEYLAEYHLVSDDPNVNTVHTDKGVLATAQVTHLKGWLDIIKNADDLSAHGDEIFNIGYGSSLQPGWQGSLTLQRGDTLSKTLFNSLKSNTTKQRPVSANQLVTFVFDLKRLTLGRFGLNRKPAKKPDDS